MKRKINEIIIHCTATPPDMKVNKLTLDRWHRARGLDGCGYHFIIHRDGTIEPGRDVNRMGAHCIGHNRYSIGIVYVGGLNKQLKPEDNRTPSQKKAMLKLVKALMTQYGIKEVHGHNEFARKACPCFSVRDWLDENDLCK